MKRSYFGTDGVRGVAGVKSMSAAFVFKLGAATAEVLSEKRGATFLIGMDTRQSGDMLKHAMAAGLTSRGAKVLDVGVIPTPGVSFLCQHLSADAGVVISASHNPFGDNGIKLFNNKGEKLADEVEIAIEAMLDKLDDLPEVTGSDIGISESYADGAAEYIAYLKKHSPDLSGMRIALDCANGAAYALAPELFTALGASIEVLHAEPDGLNINVNCGSTHPESLQAFVVEKDMDLGICFDGDADRSLLVDSKGRMVTGDHILAICGITRKESAVVSTLMGNMGSELYIKEHGLKFDRADVGDRYVKEMLLEKGLLLGGEQSGHILYLDIAPTGDGMLNAVQVLKSVKESGKFLEEWVDDIPLFPQTLVNVRVPAELKHNIAGLEQVQAKILEAEAELAGLGRINLRPSGTEALVRVMVEGKEQAMIERIAQEVADVVKIAV